MPSCRPGSGERISVEVARIEDAAVARHDRAAFEARLVAPRSAAWLRALPEDRALSPMSQRIVRAGLRHELVPETWPAFERVVAGFDPEARARLADRPANQVVGSWDELARGFERLGGTSPPHLSRIVGEDGFAPTEAVVRALVRRGVLDGRPVPGYSRSRFVPGGSVLDGPRRGRGATTNPTGRFEPAVREPFDDGWGSLEELAGAPAPATEVRPDAARSVLTRNDSPDIGFDRSVNPYRGCEHGCIYCYARPSHAYLGLSPGLDFETRIFAKHEAARLLRTELARPGYRPDVLALGSNTDPYQPVERRLGITRAILELLLETRHAFAITTKGAGILRDLDLLAEAARFGLVRVDVSLTTLDRELARSMEPRAAAPWRRLEVIRELARAGVPVGANLAPLIPGLNDHEIERVAAAVAGAGASHLNWILLRLPHEVKELFAAWLEAHFPDRAARVLSLLRQCREGRLNDPRFGHRMRGSGPLAELLAQRVEKARRRFGLDRPLPPLRLDLFRPPRRDGQLALF